MFDEEKMNYILQKRRKIENEVENCHVIYIYILSNCNPFLKS